MRCLVWATVFLAGTAAASDLACSIKASSGSKAGALHRMAKVNAADARKIALAAVNIAGAVIAKGGLEAEDGCLLYSYDIRVPGGSGVEEVFVDAGTGKVLRVEHENAAKEAAEAAAERVKK